MLLMRSILRGGIKMRGKFESNGYQSDENLDKPTGLTGLRRCARQLSRLTSVGLGAFLTITFLVGLCWQVW
jgi:hypothetical protein